MDTKDVDDPVDKAGAPKPVPPEKDATSLPPEPQSQPEPRYEPEPEPFAPYSPVGPRGGHGQPR